MRRNVLRSPTNPFKNDTFSTGMTVKYFIVIYFLNKKN